MTYNVYILRAYSNGGVLVIERFETQSEVCKFLEEARAGGFDVILVMPVVSCGGKRVHVCLPKACIDGPEDCVPVNAIIELARKLATQGERG